MYCTVVVLPLEHVNVSVTRNEVLLSALAVLYEVIILIRNNESDYK